MSASSVLRILAEHPVKPWQYQSWIYPHDPAFEARAKVIVDLYQGSVSADFLGSTASPASRAAAGSVSRSSTWETRGVRVS